MSLKLKDIIIISRNRIHLFNFISFYLSSDLATVKEEYWLGFRRKRILKLGKLTIWIRNGSSVKIRIPSKAGLKQAQENFKKLYKKPYIK